ERAKTTGTSGGTGATTAPDLAVDQPPVRITVGTTTMLRRQGEPPRTREEFPADLPRPDRVARVENDRQPARTAGGDEGGYDREYEPDERRTGSRRHRREGGRPSEDGGHGRQQRDGVGDRSDRRPFPRPDRDHDEDGDQRAPLAHRALGSRL